MDVAIKKKKLTPPWRLQAVVDAWLHHTGPGPVSFICVYLGLSAKLWQVKSGLFVQLNITYSVSGPQQQQVQTRYGLYSIEV